MFLELIVGVFPSAGERRVAVGQLAVSVEPAAGRSVVGQRAVAVAWPPGCPPVHLGHQRQAQPEGVVRWGNLA